MARKQRRRNDRGESVLHSSRSPFRPVPIEADTLQHDRLGIVASCRSVDRFRNSVNFALNAGRDRRIHRFRSDTWIQIRERELPLDRWRKGWKQVLFSLQASCAKTRARLAACASCE